MTKEKDSRSKYIVFSITKRKLKTDHIFRILNVVFLEARSLNRIPVIGKFMVHPSNNLGFQRDDFRFEEYLDLSNGTLRRSNRVDKVVENNQEWIKEEDFDLARYTADKVYEVSDKIISQEVNEKYDVIVRRNPSNKYIEKYYKHNPLDFYLDFPLSEKVNQYTDIVLEELGTSRENAIAAQHYFLNKVSTMRSCFDEATRARGSSISLRRAYYACLHVRGKQGKQQDIPTLRFAAVKKQIQSLLSYAVSKGSRIYIMSDVLDSQYFNFLKDDYKIYRYYDFPQLKQLVSSEDGSNVDNVMLYCVEKNIMKHATVKILPPHSGSTMYHLNEVYNLSILKNPPMLTKPQ